MPDVIDQPSISREGVYLDKRARQYVSRLGSWLNAEGRRARALQYLGSDPEQATVKHVGIVAEWKWTKANWNKPVVAGAMTLAEFVREGLPDDIRDTAELDLPVWVKPEWAARATEKQKLNADLLKATLLGKMVEKVRVEVNRIDEAKQYLSGLKVERAPGEPDILAAIPPDLRTRAMAAIQPPAHEVLGYTADAERLTVEQAKVKYLDDCRSRIGLAEDGINPGTYQNTDRMLRLALAVTTTDPTGQQKQLIEPKAMLEAVTRDDLIAFKRAWLAKVTAGEIAKRTAANYCKAVQFFMAWCYKRDRIITRRVADLEDVFRFTDINPINIADYADAKVTIKAILADAPERVKLYIYLALNCGYYQADIGRLKLAEIVDHQGDKCIIRRREKTSHQNDFLACRSLWPETWKLLKENLATENSQQNPEGLALLNEDGGPLYRTFADRARVDNIDSAWWRSIQATNEKREKENLEPVSFQFKQFRKLGATAMDRLGGETAQRLYRAAALEDSDKFYVRGDFATLTTALKKWRKVLKADEVL